MYLQNEINGPGSTDSWNGRSNAPATTFASDQSMEFNFNDSTGTAFDHPTNFGVILNSIDLAKFDLAQIGFAAYFLDERCATVQFCHGVAEYQITEFYTNDVAQIPLPAALPLLGAGLAGLGFMGWVKRRKDARLAQAA